MQANRRAAAWIAGTSAIAVSSVLALGLAIGQAPPKPSVTQGYIDARVCATCHRQIAATYAQTGMGRSFFPPAAANTVEDYAAAQDVYHALSDTHFSMVRRDGAVFQKRWQIGPGGQETNVEETRIDYVMGSGNHARSYLHRTSTGTLIELPFGWYSEAKPGQPAGHWGMSPGSDSDHPRTRRFVSYKCMFCHNGIPEIPAANQMPGSDPVYSGELPAGIDCQRCHGPGANHVRVVQQQGSTRAAVRGSIVNPARLDSKLRMEICMQCHLETSSGRIPSEVVRFNRGPFSYVPGEPLENFKLTFDHAPGTGRDDKFEAVSSVYRLRQSQCFLRSSGKLLCETCHNPHQVSRGAEAAAHYASVCRQCHSLKLEMATGKHTASPDCVACHMPKRRAQDTPGMIMTDHLIQRRPQGNLLAELPEPAADEYLGEVVPYYPSPWPATPLHSLYRAVAQVGLGNNMKAGLPLLAREMERQKPRDSEFYIVLGDARLRVGEFRQALAAYQQAVLLSPDSAPALLALSDGLIAAGQPVKAEEMLKRAVTLQPGHALSWYRYGLLDFASGRTAEATQKIRKAIALEPELPNQWRSLGEVLLQTGPRNEAELSLREALRTDPYDDAAWDLTGRLLTEKGEFAEAVHSFEKAIHLAPGKASHHYDYALALVRMDRFEDAEARVGAALRADPKVADAHELLGGLFERKQQFAQAAREYRTVLELRPAPGRVHLRLGTVLMAEGDRQNATEQFRNAARSADVAVAAEARQMLASLGAQ